MQKLSVSIITYNEENNIADCINSVLTIADEIIVVDSLSTDKTIEIAQSLGAKIISQKFLGHIEQKNVALKACSHEFVLSLDADERLDAQALSELQEHKKNGFRFDGYMFKRLTFIGNDPIQYGSWYPDKKLRLVRKELAEWKGINPHDKLEIKSTNIHLVKGDILHFSFTSKEDVIVNTRKFAEISAKSLYLSGKKIPTFLILIKALGRWFKHMVIKGGVFNFKYGWFIGRQQYLDCYWKYSFLNKMNMNKKQMEKTTDSLS